MRLIVDDTEIFAATGGRPFDPRLPTAVFLHGSGLDSAVWALHSRWYAYHGWSVLAVDLPGHGRSAGPALPSIGAIADWVERLIETAGIGKATLIGHSMGSLIALEAAARHPHRVSSLGLIGTAAAMPVHADLLTAAQANDHGAIDMVSIWGHGFHAALGGSQAPGLWMLGNGYRLLERARPGVLFSDLAACNDYQDGTASAAKVTCPAVLVLGERDAMTPAKAGKTLAKAIPTARVTVIKGAGHMLMAEYPNDVLDALIAGLGI